MGKLFALAMITLIPLTNAVSQASEAVRLGGSLDNCVRYALEHQPQVRTSVLNEEIAERTIWGKLADWFPQLNLTFNAQHNPQLPVAVVGGATVSQGLTNSSNVQFSASQTLFNRDVLLATSSAGDVRTFARQQTASSRIDVVVNVSRAYYATLAIKQQIALFDESVLRLEQSYKDALTKYKSGIVDNTDYKRALIALNNVRAERNQSVEELKARFAALREEMGCSEPTHFDIQDSVAEGEMMAMVDTTLSSPYEKRIEYQLLQTEKHLQEDNLHYTVWSFVPSVSIYGGYTINYQNNLFPPLYKQSYPYSFVGVTLNFPILEGGKRIQQIRQAQLQVDRADVTLEALANSIDTQHASALANYKGSLATFRALTDNLALAGEVYRTIELQYRAGTKSYLEFITAETDLRTAQVNRVDAMYRLLVSKLDLQRALGTISY